MKGTNMTIRRILVIFCLSIISWSCVHGFDHLSYGGQMCARVFERARSLNHLNATQERI